MKPVHMMRTLSLTALLLIAPAIYAQAPTTSVKTDAIQVAMIQSDEIAVPAEFQVALYENLIRQLGKRGFQHVYRDGDRNSTGASNLVILHSTVRKFKAGSEMARQVTTVAGATSVTIHCQFTNAQGQSLLEQDITGKVRFFGGNLRATYDFAKKASHTAYDNFAAGNGKHSAGSKATV
jgi:hypothetical protein